MTDLRVNILLLFAFIIVAADMTNATNPQPAQPPLQNKQNEVFCPPQELIAPCRCSQKDEDVQVWCSHSDLPRVLHGIKAVAKTINRPIDELILENNQLPSLPGRFFSPLKVVRLMLRYNGLERLANGWLNDLEDSLVEIFIVERDLRSVPVDSLMGLRNLEAVTIQSDSLKRAPIFSSLSNLRYIKIQSNLLIELSPNGFRDMPSLETVQIIGSSRLNRLEAGIFQDLPKLRSINLAENGISWIHLRALARLPNLRTIELSGNKISDAGMIGRAVKDLTRLEELKLDSNHITTLSEGSFVDLPALRELLLNDNAISEIYHGAFHRTPNLKLVHLENNFLSRVHPESFLQTSGSGVEYLHLQNNEIGRVEELRSLLDALPMLKYLDLSFNRLEEIPYGALRGHGTLEQLYLDHNVIGRIERDAFMAMPGLRELRLKNNSLADTLPLPFWNLPGLKGLDLSNNKFKRIESTLLMGLPSLRRLDISENYLSMLDPSSFANTPLLETINISRNELSAINSATFRSLDHLFEIDASWNNLQEMIPGLPRIVERLSVRNNKISNLPLPPNKSLDLPSLRMLDLGSNLLQRLPRSAFKSLSELRYLSLAKNRLQTVDEASLTGLDRLEILNLQDNRLMAMHERCLQSLSDLRDLTLQGNRLELFVDSILGNLPRLERLDASRNNIIEMSPNAFRNTRSLQALDLSENNLKELPESIAGLTELKQIDLSFNRLMILEPAILSSLRQLEELKASNNKVNAIPRGTFRDMPILQYLDLSSNELSSMEKGSIRNLPQLQELVLADNRLVEIGDRVFEELPNLQAVHLQQNNLRYMSPNSFYRSPSIVYLNISSNHFETLEHVGLRSVRNLEVLDLSNNGIRRVTTNPLRGLDWLVELKLDDNRICKVQGEPFSTMPRLRVLTMRNNKMTTIVEPTFRSLRGNLAILDLDGNPLECSCDTLWLRAWYQETDSLTNYPGPRCRDGTMLRESRLTRLECQSDGQRQSNQIPLTNEHGDIFSDARRSNIDYDECEALQQFDEFPNQLPPSPGENEYFYDQYVDYPVNETHLTMNNSSIHSINPTQHSFDPNNVNRNISNTILNYNKYKQQQLLLQQQQQQPGSQFTFFGMPLPSLNIGNLWNNGRSAKTRAATGTKGTARVQVYRPEDMEIFKFLNSNSHPTATSVIQQIDPRTRMPISRVERVPAAATAESYEENRLYHRPYFQTPFQEKLSPPTPTMEKGGFNPLIPGSSGGFRPIRNPYLNETDVSANSTKWPADDYQEMVPIVTESKKHFKTTTTKLSQSNYEQPNEDSGLVSEPIQSVQDTTFVDHTTTTMSPLHSFLADMNDKTASRYEEEAGLTTISSKINNFEYSAVSPQATAETPSTAEATTAAAELSEKTKDTTTPTYMLHETTYLPTVQYSHNYKDPWENINQAPSSLSALVAPGAQLGTYRSQPPGRSTITKIFSSTYQTPTAEEYQRTTSLTQNYNNVADGQAAKLTTTMSPTSTKSPMENKLKNKNMDWYFANYNKTTNTEDDESFDVGRNSLRSSSFGLLSFKTKYFLIASLAIYILF